jgi:hypothetical protein
MSTQPTTRPRKSLLVEGPFPPGRLVPMPPSAGFRPKAQRWHNWSVDPETGKPVGLPFQAVVPDLSHYRDLLAAGLLREVVPAAPAKKEPKA